MHIVFVNILFLDPANNVFNVSHPPLQKNNGPSLSGEDNIKRSYLSTNYMRCPENLYGENLPILSDLTKVRIAA